MPEIVVLTPDDAKLIQRLLDQAKNARLGTVNRPREPGTVDQVEQSTDIYIARTPSGGIRGLLAARPGYATCTTYCIQRTSTIPTMVLLPGVTRVVYNIDTSPIPGNTWIVVGKEKFGYWLALRGASNPIYIDPTPDTGTGTRVPGGVGTGTGTSTGTHDGTIVGTGSPAFETGLTTSIQVVTEATWNSVTCQLTKTTKTLEFTNGILTGVT